jgi:peptidoglycan/xylan/chitin deacetylase (PgdA/CDA1 family)
MSTFEIRRAILRVALVAAATVFAGCGAGGAAPASQTHPVAPPAGGTSTTFGPPTTPMGPPPATTTNPATTTPAPPAPAGYRLPDRLRGVEWSRLPTTRKVVALTFDGGSNADGALPILSTLRADGVRHATFFLTGRWTVTYPGLARQIASAGYAIGDHTTSHPHLPALTDAQIAHEVVGARRAIRTVTGVDSRPLFRFPYGDGSPRALRIVNAHRFASIRWTVDTLGWEGASAGITTPSIVQRVLDGLQPGEIVLMHLGSSPDGSTPDSDALAEVIHAIRARGYSFASVAQFTGRPAS